MSRGLKSVAFRSALETKLHPSPTLAVYMVELLSDRTLQLTDACQRRKSVTLTNDQEVAIVSSRCGVHYVVIEAVLTLKMSSLAQATRWASELQQQPPARPQPLIDTHSKASTAPARTSLPQSLPVPERYLYTIPMCMMGVSVFPEQQCDRQKQQKGREISHSSESAVGLTSYGLPSSSVSTEL